MIIETSQDLLRRRIRPALVGCLTRAVSREEAALEIVEVIALRMPSRADYQVATIGAFVRINITWLKKGRITFCALLERFTHAAVYAALGHDALVDALDVSVTLNGRP